MAAQPLDAEVHNLLGNIYLRLGLTAKAIDELRLAETARQDGQVAGQPFGGISVQP